MKKNIYKLITEQFNIGNMNLNDKPKHNINIFNKNALIPIEIYKKILNGENVNDYEILALNDFISVVKVESKDDLSTVIDFYSDNYKNESLNWLDVSDITDMSRLFAMSDYNGDISKWDVSNVIDMEWMFQYSRFNKDISKWDVSNVKYFNGMFFNSHINRKYWPKKLKRLYMVI